MFFFLRSSTKRKLISSGDVPVFNMRDTAIHKHMPVNVGNAERVRTGPHAGWIDEEIVIATANSFENSRLRLILQPRNRIAMVANLYGCPPLVAAILKMLDDISLHS